mmetsp:Transcript_10571/g.20909  ORF Transcript_10571/g.20909 Transcript_10571/m.20909 type:complete len:350 (-) Transcript_10571:342-1391(-)
MPRVSQRRRKTYGVARDLDEDFLQQRDDSENDSGDKSSDSSTSMNNDDDGDAIDDNDDDDAIGDDDDDDGDGDYSVEESDTAVPRKKKKGISTENKKRNNRISGSGGNEQKGRKKPKRNETIQKKKKKNNNNTPTNSQTEHGDSGKNIASTTVENDGVNDDDDNGETTAISATNRKGKKNIELDSFDVVLPPSIIDGGGCSSENQCTLLVEVSDTKDAIALGEFGGSVGAIGRFESDPNGITLDLKGNQYRGSLLPGPTCMVVGFPSSFGFKKKELTATATGDRHVEDISPSIKVGTLRVEGITDEYATLVQIADHMKKLDAVVTGNHNDSDENNGNNNPTKDKISKSE